MRSPIILSGCPMTRPGRGGDRSAKPSAKADIPAGRARPGGLDRDPIGFHNICEAAVHRLIALEVETPSQRLLADKAAEGLAGMAHALNGLALLVAEPARPVLRGVRFHLHVADWLPAFVSAGRTFVTILAVALFWIVTAWPSGAEAITWAAIPSILFAREPIKLTPVPKASWLAPSSPPWPLQSSPLRCCRTWRLLPPSAS